VRIISADQANQIASDRLRGSEFGPCGGGVLEKVDFVEDAAQAVLPGGEQLRTTYVIRPHEKRGLLHCSVSFGERTDNLRSWCAEEIGISVDEIRFWFEH